MGKVNNAKLLFQRTKDDSDYVFVTSLATYVSILDAGRHTCSITKSAEWRGCNRVTFRETELATANPARGPIVSEDHRNLVRAYTLAFYRYFAPTYRGTLFVLRFLPVMVLRKMLEGSVQELEQQLQIA